MSVCGTPKPAIVFTVRRWSSVGSNNAVIGVHSHAVTSNGGKGLARAFEHGLLAGEGLPSQQGDIDIGRCDLDGVAGPAGHLGGDDGGAGPREGLIHRLAGAAVVLDRPAHALDGLLGAVDGLGILVPAGNA